MKVITDLNEWKNARRQMQGQVALIPTMGFLHDGHMSLVHRALSENDTVITWIFVNPKQFGPKEDFADYPRDFDRDCQLLEEAGVHYVLSPTVVQVYPPDFQTKVSVQTLSQPLEGATRPFHFDGVATVVAKMLCLAQPHNAYFGQKDGQQCGVVKQMVADLGMLCDIVVCPTIREADGLAMSSRNVYLTEAQRSQAPVLYQALQAAAAAITGSSSTASKDGNKATAASATSGMTGDSPEAVTEKTSTGLASSPSHPARDPAAIKASMCRLIQTQNLAEIDYVSIADIKTLQEVTDLDREVMISLAVRFGKTRLIDNVMVAPS